jgi:hypothetical protein
MSYEDLTEEQQEAIVYYVGVTYMDNMAMRDTRISAFVVGTSQGQPLQGLPTKELHSIIRKQVKLHKAKMNKAKMNKAKRK